MSRLLYEKYIPADPLLAPAFADMPPGQPRRLAGWLAAALGGPASTGQDSDLRQAAGFTAAEFGEQQRTRWIALLGTAADETALPSDPAFRSAFSSCVDWLSRAALTWVQPGAAGQPGLAPRWGWGPGGPPPHGANPAGDQAKAPDQPLPGPGEPVGFAAHIKPLFREHDRQSMSFAFDLWSYDDVRARGTGILARLSNGSMPCDGAWPAARIEVFQRWISTGMQP
jgi:truncated hemoglobin YjbI